MKAAKFKLPPLTKSLSARLLLLTIAFVMLAEVLIFTPSVSRFRVDHLEDRLAAGHLAILALEATPDNMVDDELEAELLSHVDAEIVALRRSGDGKKLMLMVDMPEAVDATYDLRDNSPAKLIRDALATLLQDEDRTLRIIGNSPKDSSVLVEAVLSEAPLRDEMIYFGYRILALSLLISMITAALVYLTLHLLLVRPMRRLTENMMAFREDPEEAGRVIVPSQRSDEIGLAEAQLRDMQQALRSSLHQKTRLAAVGVAVTKINHDLRNLLSTASLVSDRLAASDDPEVRRTASTLLNTIDRAVKLCGQTLDFTREGPAVLDLAGFDLAGLVDEVGAELPASVNGSAEWISRLPAGIEIEADREQLYRVLHNIGLNAVQAGATAVEIELLSNDDELVLEIRDNGPGLAPRAREYLFQPFSGSTRSGGTGLGLAIARELLRAHGGDLTLARSDARGTAFRLRLPRDQGHRRAAQ